MTTPAPAIHDLPFAAPVPKGHDVLVVTFAGQDKTATVVLDRTTSTLYCPEDLWGPLHQDPALATTDPVALVTRWAWSVTSAVHGTCEGAVVSTRTYASHQAANTRILVSPHAAQPYR